MTVRRRECGAAVVDLVLVLVLLLPLVVGILQLALVLFVRNTAAAAAAEGARYAASYDRNGSDGVARTRDLISGAMADRYADQIDYREVTIDGAPTAQIVVHLKVPALGLGGPAVELDVVGHAVEERP